MYANPHHNNGAQRVTSEEIYVYITREISSILVMFLCDIKSLEPSVIRQAITAVQITRNGKPN
jgi:hypothetical protein